MTRNEQTEEPFELRQIYTPGVFIPSGTDLKTPLFDMDRVWKLMEGVIDIHVHSGPEAYAVRVADELELAIQACQAGMAAVVFKCHSVPNQRSTTLLQRVVDLAAKGVQVKGGLVTWQDR